MKKIMVVLIKFVALVSITTIVGCASTNEFHAYLSKPDQFNPDRVNYFSDTILIKDNKLFDQGYSFFRLNYTKTNNAKVWYIDTTYHSADWLFVQSLRFVVDGKIYTFLSSPSPKRETGILVEAYVEESNQFVLSDAFIADFQKAKTVALRLEGQHYYQDKTLEPVDVKNMIWFINYINEKMAKPA